MTAYVISRVTMKPGPAFEAYRRLAAASITRHGGRYPARGGAITVLEGEWRAGAVLVAFPSVEAARAWYASPDYVEALAHRDDAVERDLIVVEGIDS